jgi:hypothetical protein
MDEVYDMEEEKQKDEIWKIIVRWEEILKFFD